MEIRATKTKEGLVLSGQLPLDLENAHSLEIYPLRDGAYLLTVKGFLDEMHGFPVSPGSALAESEMEVIRKLSAVRFEKRIPSEVDRMLSAPERKVLSALVEKKLITVFRSGKYGKEGVYNITDGVYPMARGMPSGASVQMAQIKPAQQESKAQPSANMPDALSKKGWMVLENENEARSLSDTASALVKNGDVIGIRAFDRKYYFISKSFLEKWEGRICGSLAKGNKTADELSDELGIEPDGCRAILYNLCDEGAVLEKQKGKFASA